MVKLFLRFLIWLVAYMTRDPLLDTVFFCVKNLFQWSSRKQKVVALSSAKAEYRALSQTATEIGWVRSLFAELKLKFSARSINWCDNQSADSLASNPVYHARTKHIEIDVHYI